MMKFAPVSTGALQTTSKNHFNLEVDPDTPQFSVDEYALSVLNDQPVGDRSIESYVNNEEASVNKLSVLLSSFVRCICTSIIGRT